MNALTSTRTIWKHLLIADATQEHGEYVICTVELPTSAKILHVDDQRGAVTLWTSVHKDDASTKKVRFAVVPTGGSIPEGAMTPTFIGTVLQAGGERVWHIFLL